MAYLLIRVPEHGQFTNNGPPNAHPMVTAEKKGGKLKQNQGIL